VRGIVIAKVLASLANAGPSSVIELVENNAILAQAEAIGRSLTLSGFLGLDFIVDAARPPWLLEVNPRITPTAHLASPTGSVIDAVCAQLGLGHRRAAGAGDRALPRRDAARPGRRVAGEGLSRRPRECRPLPRGRARAAAELGLAVGESGAAGVRRVPRLRSGRTEGAWPRLKGRSAGPLSPPSSPSSSCPRRRFAACRGSPPRSCRGLPPRRWRGSSPRARSGGRARRG